MPAGLFMYVLFLILGLSSGAFRRVSNQRKTTGTVYSLKQRHIDRSGRLTKTALISFSADDKTYRLETSYQSSFFRTGKKLTVYYDEKAPQNSFVGTGAVIYLLMALLAIAGSALLVKDLAGF